MKNKKLAIGMAAALALVMVLTGTFAWFATSNSVKNRFKTANFMEDGSLAVFEIFEGGDGWEPGDVRVKDVAIANNSETDALVRVSFEETMSKLSGSVQQVASKYAAGTAVPQLTKIAMYTTGDWKDTTGYTVTGLDTGVTLRMLKTTKTDPAVTVFNFFLYAPISIAGNEFDGQNQRVTATVKVDDVAKTIAVSNIQYYQYSGKTVSDAAWAVFAQPQTSATPALRPAADIGFAALDSVNQYITIQYTDAAALIEADPADADSKWWYNADDGFFYFIGKVASGTVSKSLMESVTLSEDAGNAYGNMNFDLFVNMEGVQNSLEAVKDVWGLNETDDAALLAALAPYLA